VQHKALVKKIYNDVIIPGNCFHCGLCEGLSNDLFKMHKSSNGPIPKLIRKPMSEDSPQLEKILLACPGRGFPYGHLSKKIGAIKKDKILGNYNNLYVGSSNDDTIREKSSSGGIVRTLLIELIKSNKIDYVCFLDENKNKILDFELLITSKINDIINCSQSIYQTTAIFNKLKTLKRNKSYAFVGLPEHVASLRVLKIYYPKEFKHIKYLISIYSGTNMYPGAIEFFLKGNGIKSMDEVKKIFWRYGEWPGLLRVETKNKILSLKKFYYNYLIPFFISKNCLITPDFTGELSDISIGDAWSPVLEKKGHGYSIIISRSSYFDKMLNNLHKKKIIDLKKNSKISTIQMHSHMLEFKKIGSYLRLKKLEKKGPVPLYDLRPYDVSYQRRLIESIIGFIIKLASNKNIKYIFSLVSSNLLGIMFEFFRSLWKSLTKPTKRKGFLNQKFIKIKNDRLNEFL